MNRSTSMQKLAENIIASRVSAMTFLRLILVLSIIAMGSARFWVVARKIIHDEPYFKDIFVEYLMAKAVLNGDNPYLPLDELARMYVGELPYYPHPSPHPPVVSILFLPLTLFPQQFDIVWLLCELFFILLVSILLTYWARGGIDLRWLIFMFFLMLAWLPVQFDLDYGQMSIFLLLLLVGSWLSIRRGSKILGGFLLGLSIGIKLITIPVLLYLIFRKDWRTAISAGITFLGCNLITAAVIGLGPVWQFYTQVSPRIFPFYRGYAYNYSSWSIGWRLFYGTGSPLSLTDKAPPLFYSPVLAAMLSFLLPMILLSVSLIWAIKARDMDVAFALMVCISVVVSPISWLHYYTMLIIPIAIGLRWVVKRGYPLSDTLLFMVLLLFLFFVNGQIPSLMSKISGSRIAVVENRNQVSFLVGLLNLIPIIEVIVLSWLLIHLKSMDLNRDKFKSTSQAGASMV